MIRPVMNLSSNYNAYIKGALLGAAAFCSVTFTACDALNDDYDDCPKEILHKVEINYDRNIVVVR